MAENTDISILPGDTIDTIKIHVDLVIAKVAQLHSVLMKEWRNDKPISVDLSEVNACDTAGIQLLCSMLVESRKAGFQMEVIACTPEVSTTAKNLGIVLTLPTTV